jgi:SOS-response transcriptional repressor LexA
LDREMTEVQNQVYMVLDAYWRKYGFGPSMEEVMNITGYKSKSNVHRIMVKLCDLGYCKRLPRSARSVRPSYLKIKDL